MHNYCFRLWWIQMAKYQESIWELCAKYSNQDCSIQNLRAENMWVRLSKFLRTCLRAYVDYIYEKRKPMQSYWYSKMCLKSVMCWWRQRHLMNKTVEIIFSNFCFYVDWFDWIIYIWWVVKHISIFRVFTWPLLPDATA